MIITDVPNFEINYLTQAQYDEALNNGEINDLALYCVKSDIPYIIESGTNGTWIYRKWSDGKYEAFSNQSDSFAMTNGIDSTYYGNYSYNISDLLFTSIISVQITGHASGSYFGSKIESSSTTGITISARASASTTAIITHYIYIMGTWK